MVHERKSAKSFGTEYLRFPIPLFRSARSDSRPLHASDQNQPSSILVAIRTILAAVGRFLDQLTPTKGPWVRTMATT